jgi:hypothetical protein
VIAAGAAEKAPLLVQTSEGAVKHMGLENAVTIVRALAERSQSPVALHLDHGKSEELARAAVDVGYTSVMIDASRQSYDENMRETAHIVEYAHVRGVHVEAELGTLGGIEDLGETEARSMLTDPDQAVRFAHETGVDALAVAIGTSHGAYKFKGVPHLDLERLKEIAGRIPQPIVLHGASSMPEEGIALAERYGARLPTRPGHSARAHPPGGGARCCEGQHRLRPPSGGARTPPARSWPNARSCSISTSSWASSRRPSGTRPSRAFECSAATEGLSAMRILIAGASGAIGGRWFAA